MGMALVLVLGVSACATRSVRPSGKPATTEEHVGEVLNQPFSDLNISGDEIPPRLLAAAKAPYAPPSPNDCAGIAAEIAALENLLGPDLKPAKTKDDKAILTEDSASNAAWDAARGAAVGWIPFRGVMRFVTGAERRDARIKHAILSGFVRRAYLNGLAQAQNCPAPPSGAKPSSPG